MDVRPSLTHAFEQTCIGEPAEFVGVAGQRKQRRVRGRAAQRCKLVPGPSTEAHREQAVRRNIHVAQCVDESAWRAFELRVGDSGETQLRATTAGYGREHAMACMPMEGMSLRTHREGMQRGGFAPVDIGSRQHRRWFVERVVEPAVSALARLGLAAQAVSRAMAQLRNERDLHGQVPAA